MENFKIALIGYGNMGKELKRLATLRNMNVTQIFDEDSPIFEAKKFDFDVALDFSIPSAVLPNAEIVAKAKKNLVVGTTGWYDKSDTMKQIALDNNIGIVWGANFSLGMQIFFRLTALAAELADSVGEYDIFVHEIHHRRKKDSPSGTAHNLGNIILENFDEKSKILVNTPHAEIHQNQLHVTSTRGGHVLGTHTVYLDSEVDTLELTHRARNRSGFAGGALKAAELIHGKKGYFSFEELLGMFWEKK